MAKYTVRFLKVSEVAELLGISIRQLQRLVAAGELPPPVCIGRRSKRFRSTDVAAYMAACTPKGGAR